MKSIIKFLVNCYEAMIVLGFFLSIIGYLFYVLVMVVTIMGASNDADINGYMFAGGLVSIFAATFFEFFFLVALGAAAVLVDIRNEMQETNRLMKVG